MMTTDWTEATRNWRPPSEIAGQGPREVRLTGGGIGLTVLSLLMFLGAGVAFWFMSRTAAREAAVRAALDNGSIEAQATVIRHWRTGGKSDTPMIAYDFEYQGRVYHGQSPAPRQQWRVLPVGSTLPVRFVPGDPEINHPSAWSVRVMPSWLPMLIAGILAVVALIPMSLPRRETRLLRDGRAAPAIVTGHRRGKGGYAIIYEFRQPDGSMRRGRGSETRTPPEIGSVISVVYDPEKPRRNAPYPFTFARIER